MLNKKDSKAWLWGWDDTPGIVSVWADRDGNATIWQRSQQDGSITRSIQRFHPWVLLATLEDIRQSGVPLQSAEECNERYRGLTYRELTGPGHLRYLISGPSQNIIKKAIKQGIATRSGNPNIQIHDLSDDDILILPPEEQYLVATGRTYFRSLIFDDLHRLQFDLETTGLDAEKDAIFLIAIATNRGLQQALDIGNAELTNVSEIALIRSFCKIVQDADPDVIENHNLLGFDLPFIIRRAQILGIPFNISRVGAPGTQQRPASRGYGQWRGEGDESNPGERRGATRPTIPGRECIDTLDAVRRYDFAARDLPGHGLKVVARYFDIAASEREYITDMLPWEAWLQDPDRVRHYAMDDVIEAGRLAHILGGAAFALAQMAPRRYERLADAGPATGILDPLIVRAYTYSGCALPARSVSDGEQHSGAALHLFAEGVAHRIVKADVASLYPSLMCQYQISPRCDYLGVLLSLVDQLVQQRLSAKARGKAAPIGSAERHGNEAISAAMKILVNSAYGYLGAVGLTRLADIGAANEVTRRGRDLLALICRELAQRGATLLEADTDGVYFSAPETWTEQDERKTVAEVAALLPPLVRLEFEGRFAAMLSHETKNYALLTYDDKVILRGVAFRSIKFEPFGERFLRQSVGALLRGDIPGIRQIYMEISDAIRKRILPISDVSTRCRLTKSSHQYLTTRPTRRELPYEALLASGRTEWNPGEQIYCYRISGSRAALLPSGKVADSHDYDVSYYLRLLDETYAARLARAFTSEDFSTLFGSVSQMSLFSKPIEDINAILKTVSLPPRGEKM
jgi:DNA polymerase I